MATKKAGGSTRNGRDSNPKMLGVKKFGGEAVIPGNILVRQRGSRFYPSSGVAMGNDHTLYALVPGKVNFRARGRTNRVYVSIVEEAAA